MKRRDFCVQLAATGSVFSGLAHAQGAPVEGRHYTRLAQPAPVSTPAGKVEVVEFFWYGCPHCFALEPTLDAWAKKLPADVVLKRVPVGFGAVHRTHQELFYALEAMGLLDTLHAKVFVAIHQQRQRLDKEDDIVAFVVANGVDGDKFREQFRSFSVKTKARQASQRADSYKIVGVPALGVRGRYLTSGGQAGSNERALAVTEALIQQSRKPG
jgi:thiol:disulfide interchange protein DsbA